MDTPNRYIELRRVRDFGATINVIFEFLRFEWKPLGKAILYIMAPVLIIGVAVSGLYISSLFGGVFGRTMTDADVGTDEIIGMYTEMAPMFALSMVVLLIAVALMYGIVGGYVRLYIDRRGETPIEVDDVWREARGSLLRILGTVLLSAIICYVPFLIAIVPAALTDVIWLIPIGFLLAIVPVIYLYNCVSIIVPLRLEEEGGYFTAFGRCIRLIKGRWWFTFGVLFVMSILLMFASTIFQAPLQVIVVMGSLSGGEPSPVLLVGAGMLSAIGSYLLYSILFLTTSVLYYNLVEGKEGVGMVDRINEIGSPVEGSGATSI